MRRETWATRPRYYDFNVWSQEKLYEKMQYIHHNPVRRGLVERAEDWKWSSFRHIASGEEGIVEVESSGRRENANGWA